MNEIVHQTKWLYFRKHKRGFKKKTDIYDIYNKESNTIIGQIRWYSGFRQYSFFPCPDTVYEKTCMADITAYLVKIGEEHKDQQRIIDIATGKTEQ